MKVRIWGARGSIPAAITSEEIADKIVQAIHKMPALDTSNLAAVQAYVSSLPPLERGTAGGATTCVEIQAGSETIIIDAGTGLYRLGLELMKGPCGQGKGVLHFIFSHLHWDHLQGFPMFTPAFIPGNRFFIHSIHDAETALMEQQRFQYFPVTLRPENAEIPHHNAEMTFIRHAPDETFKIGRVQVQSSRNHHPGTAYAYRFDDPHSSFVFASDAEYHDLEGPEAQKRIAFFKNADALLFDAQYGLRDSWESKTDFGHSSAMIGVYMARIARVKRLLLTHHDPTYNDRQLLETLQTAITYQAQGTELQACQVMLAYEGLLLDLAPKGAVEIETTPDGESSILTASTVFDQTGVIALQAHMDAEAAGTDPRSSVLDLSDADQLTPAGLKALVRLNRGSPNEPIVLAGVSPAVRETIHLAGYGDYFAIYPTVEAAVQAIKDRRALELPGEIIAGRYLIQEKLEQGRLGTILKAEDQQTGQLVALKLLSPALSKETLEKIHKQHHRAQELRHPAIVPVLDWGQEGDLYYLVEAWVPAETLADRLAAHGSLTLETAEALIMDLLQALEHAHRLGIIHGHIKPTDVLLSDAQAQLGGFGLSRLEEGINLLETPAVFLQTAYLSPEQVLGQPLDVRTDLYSLGVLLFEAFTGAPPFTGKDQDILQAHLSVDPVFPFEKAAALSRPIVHMILKLLSKNPNDRYPSAWHVRQVLEGLQAGILEGDRSQRRLIGRDDQLTRITEAWQRVQTGRGELLLISGEPGIGKTTLALTGAAQIGAPILLVGHCYATGDLPTYQPFREILETYLASAPSELDQSALHPLLGTLTQLVPHLRKQVPDLPDLPKLEPEAAQLRLFSSYSRFLQAAAAARPWVLVLDDLQWIDAGSLELFRYLARQINEMRILVIGTYRETDITDEHLLEAALRDLNTAPGYHQIQLDRLDEPGVVQVLSALWDRQVPRELVAQIHHHTGGNPLFVEEVARSLMEDRLVYPVGASWMYPHNAQIRLPATISEAVEGRIHFLAAETRDLLTLAAVLGEMFRFGDLVTLSGLSEWEVLDHLDLLLARQLIQEVPGGDIIRFRHREIHSVIYNDLGELRRRRLHLRAGEALEAVTQQASTEQAALLAYHFRAAGNTEEAVQYSITAGKQAQAIFDNEKAIGLFNQALDLITRSNLPQRFELVLQREAIHQLQGARTAQLNDLDELRVMAAQLGAAEQTIAEIRRAEYAAAIGDYSTAAEKARTAITLAHSIQRSDLEIQAALTSGEAAMRTGEYSQAEKILHRALELAKTTHHLQALARTHNTLGTLAAIQGKPTDAQAQFEAGLAIVKQINAPQQEIELLLGLGVNASWRAVHAKSLEYFEQVLERSQAAGDRRMECKVLNNIGFSYFRLGQYETAREHCLQGLPLAQEINERAREGLLYNNLAHTLRTQEDYAQARSYYEQALSRFQEIGHREYEGFTLSGLSEVYWHLGDPAKAWQFIEDAFELRLDLGNPIWLIETRARMVWWHLQEGNLSEAHQYAEVIYEYLQAGESLYGALEPLRIPLEGCKGLLVGKDPRAKDLIEQTYAMLQAQADLITKPKLRQSFLEAVPWHREITTLRHRHIAPARP